MSIDKAHVTAELAGITFNDAGGLSAGHNYGTTFSRATAKALLASGVLTQGQFISLMNRIAAWEQTNTNFSVT